MPKTLTIKHDGKLVVSGYGTLRLGDTSLSTILTQALALRDNDHEEYAVDMEITIRFKDNVPDVRWVRDPHC